MITVIRHRSPEAVAAQKAGCYVYVGRPSKWGNPYTIGRDGTRDEVIEKFRRYWYAPKQAKLRTAALDEIPPYAVLGCFCFPLACHAQIIADFLNHAGY